MLWLATFYIIFISYFDFFLIASQSYNYYNEGYEHKGIKGIKGIKVHNTYSKLLSRKIVPTYASTSNVWKFLFQHILSSTTFFFFS